MKEFTDADCIKALKKLFNTNDVQKTESTFENEPLFVIDDKQLVSVFNSDVCAKAYYSDAIEYEIYRSPAVAMRFFDKHLGKDTWKKYIQIPVLIDAIKTVIKSTGKDSDPDMIKKIESDPYLTLKSFFDMSNPRDRLEFYSFVLMCKNNELVEDAVNAAILSAKVKEMVIPEINEKVKVYDLGDL